MASEDRLKRKTLEINKEYLNTQDLKNQTRRDDQDTNQNDTIHNTIVAGLVIGAGVGVYKSGLLKGIISPLKQAAAGFAADSYKTLNTVKKWANSVKDDVIETVVENGEEITIKRNNLSIFNPQRKTSIPNILLETVKSSYDKGELYTNTVKNIIKDSSDDLNALVNMIQEQGKKGISKREIKEITNLVKSEFIGEPEERIQQIINDRIEDVAKKNKLKSAGISNIDLVKNIREYNKVMKTINLYDMEKSEMFAANILSEDFIKNMTLTDEIAKKQLRETGYRNLTLGDIFDSLDFETGEFKFKEGITPKLLLEKNININDFIGKQEEGKRARTIVDEISNFISNPRNRFIDKATGKPVVIGSDENIWKNFILDSGLNISEDGDIINYMMSEKSFKFFANSLRHDFGLPVLGFNPLDTFMKVSGMDNITRKKINFGIVKGEDFYNAFISGVGGRNADDISTALRKQLGAPEDETFNILFSNNNIYALGSKGTNKLIDTGYNIYNVDSMNSLPKQVDSFRIMGGYDLKKDNKITVLDDILGEIKTNKKPFDPRMSLEEYQKTYNIELNKFQKIKYEFGRMLELGYQEMKPNDVVDEFSEDVTERLNVDKYFDNILEKITNSEVFKTNGFQYSDVEEVKQDLLNRYGEAFGSFFKEMSEEIGDQQYTFKPNNFVLMKQGIGVSSLIEDIKDGDKNKFLSDTYGMFRQYFAGFDKEHNMSPFYNESSTKLFDVFNVLDSGLASIGLGLDINSKRSTGALVSNLILKRALPVFALTQIPGMINYYSEPFFTNKEESESGNLDNIGKTIMRDIVKPIDIFSHKIGDITGFTSMMKHLQELTPGYEYINELPGIYQLGLGQTEEERKEYIEKGYDPIRKNRYWSVSNTPFTGSKINYWRPNIYRRIEADTKFSSTKYGSRGEYYSNTWYPNLVNPLAPINHFILDPHHWDNKHYYDRPYAETAAKGENIPLIGPLVSGTVGQIYRKRMHEEYWNENGTLKPVNVQDEMPSRMLSTGISKNILPTKNHAFESIRSAWVNTKTFNDIKYNTQQQYKKAQGQSLNDLLRAKRMLYSYSENKQISDSLYAANISSIQGIKAANNINNLFYSRAKQYPSSLQTSSLPYRDYNRYDTALDIYTTPSGSINIVDVPENLNLYKVNEEIKHYSLNKIYGTNQRVDINEYDKIYEEKEPERTTPDTLWNFGEQVNDLYNIYGLRGFFIKTFATGEANIGAKKVDTSSYAYSANRSFWDQNLGGFGGELSEIARRFIHKKDNNTEWLNPIRNTMPTWMPGSNYFTDFLHGDPYTKVMNGEERLPGEAYERLNNIKFSFNVNANMLGKSRADIVKHFLHQDTNITYDEEREEIDKDRNPKVAEILSNENFLIATKQKISDERYGITSVVDGITKDYSSSTGRSLINIRGVGKEEFRKLKKTHGLRNQDYYEMNFNMYSLRNTQGNAFVYYYNKDNPEETYEAKVRFSMKDLKSSIQNLTYAKNDIYSGLKNREISRGDLYSLIDKYRILADVAPYSQEFKDISSQISHSRLTSQEKEEIKAIRDRVKAQKEPLRTYNYKFKTANLKSESVTVKDIIDNNTLLVNEYGRTHAIKFAGIRVSESNSTLYGPTVKEKKTKSKTGRTVTKKTGKTMNDAAYDEIRRYLKPGQKITISYDADEKNKYGKDSTESIKAVITSKGTNVNRALLNKGLAKEKENDESPAGIHARYSNGEIAFGSIMERIMHRAADIPIFGDKFLQVRSPYEQYRKREVYDKDFKTWNRPIRNYLIPAIQDTGQRHPLSAVVTGAFLGSLFGRPAFKGASGGYGKLMGAVVGGSIGAIASGIHILGSDKDHEYRPRRRRQQEELNTYMDTLKYIKNTRLFNKYKELAKKENHFDVDKYIEKHKEEGDKNKERAEELNRYKKLVKLDFKHRGNYNFKYGKPKYEEKGQDKKATIRAINRELADIGNDRKVEKLPLNAIKALAYRDEAQKTVYAFQPGDDIRNIMSALPKKERQYFSELVKAPEEEKQKILRIAPSYLRKALQSSWGMKVDERPNLTEYFKSHALPDENWEGWSEDTDLDNVKVKMVHAEGMDPGEFDIWNNNKSEADKVNIPIPRLRVRNDNTIAIEAQLSKILNSTGMTNIQVMRNRGLKGNNTTFNIREDSRSEVEDQIKNMNYGY